MWAGQPSAGGPPRCWDGAGGAASTVGVVDALKAPQGGLQPPPGGPPGGPTGCVPEALYQGPGGCGGFEDGPAARCCAGCGAKILDRFLLHALDRYWHNGCLKCSCCQATLADIGSSCFTKHGMILCRNDYIRLFGNSGACSGCGQMIPANDYVMRAAQNVYHVKCFACVKCHSQLVPGDRYNLVNGSVLCEQDCLKMLKGSPATVRKGKVRAAIKV
ncbi:LIM domain transcription factor LMO4-like [Ornithodoros turicata]